MTPRGMSSMWGRRRTCTSGSRILVSKIADAQYSVVDTEADALLLENNLIKQYKPRYNILLKDSKTYPWICVTGDEFPRVFITRRVDKAHGNRYFGPYSSVMHARNLVDFFRETYPLRTCNLNITSEAILKGKFRPCLDFHIGRCKAPCIGKISKKEYADNIEEIVRILTGRGGEVIRHYKALMAEAAERLNFEDAQLYKEKAQSLEKHYAKSIITSAADTSADVFSLVLDANEAFGNFLRIRGGAIVQSLNLGFRCGIEEESNPSSANCPGRSSYLSCRTWRLTGWSSRFPSGATSSPSWNSAPRTPRSSISTALSSVSIRIRTSSA